MENNTVTMLRWYDLISLTAIFFAYAIYLSTASLISSAVQIYFVEQVELTQSILEFSDVDNYGNSAFQTIFLLLGFAYLKLRQFDFTIWRIRFSLKTIGFGLLLFLGVSLCMDIYTVLMYAVLQQTIFPPAFGEVFISVIRGINFSTIIYAVLNGFYEEIFFLGICTAVQDTYKKRVFIYSLFIRFSLHIYQGLSTAVGVSFIFGSVFYFIYEKSKTKNLLPFFIAHALSDIFGLSVLGYFKLF